MVKPNFKKLLTCILTILVLSLNFCSISKAQSLYTPLYNADTLTEVNHTSFQWGDYSNSGHLGFIISGYNDGNLTEVYRRDTFGYLHNQTNIEDTLLFVTNGAVTWGDYNNDGLLDILTVGSSDSGYVARVYKNLGNNTFNRQHKIFLKGVTQATAAWCDYNNDGRQDILITGYTAKGRYVSKIYRNNGNNNFTEQFNINLDGVDFGSVVWGDYNNDGFSDILLTGYDSTKSVTKIYKNNGNGNFTEQTTIVLPGVEYSSVAWGDYDNDGYLDILLTGYAAPNIISKVYRNNGDGTFTEQTGIVLPGVAHGSAAWGDFNNDGKTDILLTGRTYKGDNRMSELYKNNGDGTFTIADTLPGVEYGTGVWGDYNNDGILDIFLSGYNNKDSVYKTRIFKAKPRDTINTPPLAPTNLQATTNRDIVSFSWNKATDNETPQNGLSYNIRIGTTPGGINILSPMADAKTGYRRIVASGKINTNSYSINSLSAGKYYWSVQAIDNGFMGGAWATEGSFTISAVQASNITYKSLSVHSALINWTRGNGDSCIVFIAEGTRRDSIYYPTNLQNYKGDSIFRPTKGYDKTGTELMDTSGWYCAYKGKDSRVLIDSLKDGFNYTVYVLEYYNSGNGVHYNLSLGYKNDTTFQAENIFKEQPDSFVGVKSGAVAWGDYNNDGNLDLVITGKSSGGNVFKLYKNNGNGTFSGSDIDTIGYNNSSIAWGDFNNDNLADILVTGSSTSATATRLQTTKVYKNNGNGTFTEQKNIVLANVSKGSVAWGDYNNDGHQDILLTGWNGSAAISKLYQNNGDGTFSENTSANLTGVYYSSLAWGDFNNDGFPDILLTGFNTDDSAVSYLYKNNGDGTFSQVNIKLPGVGYSSVAWGDYNNDGNLDILLSGLSENAIISQIWENNGDGTFTEQTNVTLPGIISGSALWADINNDGYQDILLVGNGFSRYFENNHDGTFQEIGRSIDSLTQVFNCSAAIADFDKDGKTDLFISGDEVLNLASKLYKNNAPRISNIVPAAPSSLVTSYNNNTVNFQWNKATDNETPTNGLSYNIRIGTTPGGADIINPMSDPVSGFRRIVALGNVGQNNSYIVNNLPKGIYYWSVQAIDNCYAGGIWATEQSFNSSIVSVDQSKLSEIRIFPNPAKDYLTISRKSDNLATIIITDLNGRNILSEQINNAQENINIQSLQTGIYILHYNDKDNAHIFKFVKE
jgi:hypothetical protein